jgi:hypothetical protein
MKSFKFLQSNDNTLTDEDWYLRHGAYPRPRVNTVIANNRLTRLPISQVPTRQEYDTPELRGIFLQGWRACESGREVYNNPYSNVENLIYSQHSAWEMGYLDCFNARRTNPYVEEAREYITDMFNNRTQHYSFYAGAQNARLDLEYEGDMNNQSVRAMLHDLTYRYRTCLYFSNLTLNNMEDFLNEHLDGRSIIRLA